MCDGIIAEQVWDEEESYLESASRTLAAQYSLPCDASDDHKEDLQLNQTGHATQCNFIIMFMQLNATQSTEIRTSCSHPQFYF